LHDVFDENLSISKFCKEFEDCEMTDDFPERAIEFLSSQFFEIDSSFLKGLPISILIRILSNSSLKVETEDSLYKMIRSQNESNFHFRELFSFVRFEFLSIESIQDFILWRCDNFESFEQFFSLNVWIAICGRLCVSVDIQSPIQRYCVKCLHFIPQSASPLVGIIFYLTSQPGGNVHDRGIVNISGSTFQSSYVAKNAIDLLSTSYFDSQNEPNQWLCYDFKDRKVRPTHYSISAHSSDYWLRSWIFEGSMDGPTWTELDGHINDQTTNSNHPIRTFSVSNHFSFRYLRLRQTGVNAQGSHYFVLYAMEIFGDLIE
jgi:hypothetical protein